MSKCQVFEVVYSAPHTIVELDPRLAGGDTLDTANSVIPFPRILEGLKSFPNWGGVLVIYTNQQVLP